MRFLVAIKDTSEESKNILKIAVKIAEGFSANLSVIFCGEKSRAIIEGHVALTMLSMSEWNIYHPGIEVLRWVYDTIEDFGVFSENVVRFDPAFFSENLGRLRMILPNKSGKNIRLLLREGDLITEFHKETQVHDYEIAIIGDPNSRKKTHQFVQFLNTSVFIIKNFNPAWDYKILLCVDDSKATKRAVVFAGIISKHFNAPIHVITVSKTKLFKSNYRGASTWAKKYLHRKGIPCRVSLLTGDPVSTFLREAGQDHIIVMGKSENNELFQFISGSKPIHTAQKSETPVLLTKAFHS